MNLMQRLRRDISRHKAPIAKESALLLCDKAITDMLEPLVRHGLPIPDSARAAMSALHEVSDLANAGFAAKKTKERGVAA